MNAIPLTGLRPDLPIGAMAAFGVLRICERIAGLRGSKLRWENNEYAVLEIPGEAGEGWLVDALVEDVRSASEREELTWSEQIKTATLDTFRKKAATALEKRGDAAEWFAAFGTELQLDRSEEFIEPTPFDMSVARQKFLADALKLARSLTKNAETAYREALFGPWRYADDQHSLGWDPGTMKLGAFTHRAPTTMANCGVRAAVWLAFEALPLFPCFYAKGLAITAFHRQGRDYTLCWPVWRDPVSLNELRALLAWEGLVADDLPVGEMQIRGVTAIYQSRKFKPNKYLSSFQPAELVATAAE
jgi:hypothetical protein